MATWTNIADTFLEPGKPVRSVDGLALRDNPIAIAEGAAGAPRVESDLAVNWNGGGTGATSARDWVLEKTALASAGSIGSYAFLALTVIPDTASPGSVRAASNLMFSSGGGSVSATTPSGSWLCMGFAVASSANDPVRATLWLRIS